MKILLTMTIALLAVAAGGCAVNPVNTAQTVEQKAFATYGTFVIMETQAAALVQNPTLPQAAVSAIQSADTKAKPVMDSLLAAVLEEQKIVAQVKAGTNTQAKADAAIANMTVWVNNGVPLLTDLVNAVKGATK
jgi:hypothetical protein